MQTDGINPWYVPRAAMATHGVRSRVGVFSGMCVLDEMDGHKQCRRTALLQRPWPTTPPTSWTATTLPRAFRNRRSLWDDCCGFLLIGASLDVVGAGHCSLCHGSLAAGAPSSAAIPAIASLLVPTHGKEVSLWSPSTLAPGLAAHLTGRCIAVASVVRSSLLVPSKLSSASVWAAMEWSLAHLHLFFLLVVIGLLFVWCGVCVGGRIECSSKMTLAKWRGLHIHGQCVFASVVWGGSLAEVVAFAIGKYPEALACAPWLDNFVAVPAIIASLVSGGALVNILFVKADKPVPFRFQLAFLLLCVFGLVWLLVDRPTQRSPNPNGIFFVRCMVNAFSSSLVLVLRKMMRGPMCRG